MLFYLSQPYLNTSIHAGTLNGGLMIAAGRFGFDLPYPTHWMPLPAPPMCDDDEQ